MVSRRTARAMADQNDLTNEEMEAVQVQLGMVKVNAWMIDPREVKRLWIWDATTASCLIFVAMITPIEVGFLEPSTSWWDPLFLINQLINVIFVLDLVLQFFLMVSITDNTGTRWVSHPWVIAKHYLKGWFFIDLLSIGVASIDYLPLLRDTDSALSDNGGSEVDNLRTLRILRALRLIRLSKLITGQRIIKRWETKVAINYAAISLVKVRSRMDVRQGSPCMQFKRWSAAQPGAPSRRMHPSVYLCICLC